jgi:organic hydroperoxide reductase OsmC/OhrA
MSGKQHHFRARVTWSAGAGIPSGKTYSRDHVIGGEGKPDIPGSSDPAFRGDGTRYNPEELLVASLSGCHMLWYLRLCANAGIAVTNYRDEAEGTMVEDAAIGGRFEQVTLRPHVTIAGGDAKKARTLHAEAHRLCFIANSVNFPVDCEPHIEFGAAAS